MTTVPPSRDPRVRDFVPPQRVLWHTRHGVRNAEALLGDDDAVAALRRAPGEEPPAILLDFGRELHGGVRFDCPWNSTGKPVRVRVRFGESASEAMGSPNNDHAIHDLETLLPWMGHQEIGCTGFRFVRLDLLEEDVELHLRHAVAVFLHHRDPEQGSFECSDDLLNRIWRTGAYTVHLCMQDHVWDGVKRDRLVWIGDMHPETRVVSTVYGAHPLVPRSLDLVRDRTPLPAWMNGISSYSLWWILCHRDWYLWHGDLAYLAQQSSYLEGLLELVLSRIGPDGGEMLDGHRFLEWPTARDDSAISAGLQALVALALQAGRDLCHALGESDMTDRCDAALRNVMACRRPTASKQATALAVLAGMADPEDANRSVLAVDPFRGISTFYGYYVLEARAMAMDVAGCLDLIRRYWGGMLAMGATTFWEHFELDWTPGATPIVELPQPGRPDIHADFGDHCYVGWRHSLCHGWAAGPTAWLSEHVLGVSPAAPGFARVRIRPKLGDLEWARGSVPTPRGRISVEHRASSDGSVESEISLPESVELVD